ncbi:MAG: response regulator, partial [Holophaga sp.]
IRLPDISGLEALKILKEDPATAQIPVIAISAHASPRDIAEAMEAGFFQYLAKPINLAEFLSAMDAALNLRKQESVKGLKPFQAGE